MKQTGIFEGRVQVPYAYGCYGYTRGGGTTWHGGIDLVGLDSDVIRMPYYTDADGNEKPISGKVVRSRIVTDHSDKTWEWGYYICVQLDADQTPDPVNFLYFCHCSKLLVEAGKKVISGQEIAIMGNSGNAALNDPPYDHCHLEVRATSTGRGLDPTAYCGTANAAGVYQIADTQAGSRLVIDVSHHQGAIDWSKVPYPAILRVGYRGYGNGKLMEDGQFERNVANAAAVGKLFAFYFFSQAMNAAEGKEEAEFSHKIIAGRGKGLPLFIDCEWSNANRNGRADGVSKAARTAAAEAFCARAKELGYTPGIYTFTSFAGTYLDYEGLCQKYVGWLADTRANYNTTLPRYIHQYGQGYVSGINGTVDMNRVIKELPDTSKEVPSVNQLQKLCIVNGDADIEARAKELGLPVQTVTAKLIGPASAGDAMDLWGRAEKKEMPYFASFTEA